MTKPCTQSHRYLKRLHGIGDALARASNRPRSRGLALKQNRRLRARLDRLHKPARCRRCNPRGNPTATTIRTRKSR